VHYQVDVLHPALSIDRAQLHAATDVKGLNQHFDEAWVAKYKSMDITVIVDGKEEMAFAKNDQLTQPQLALLRKADPHTKIKVSVHYLPDNTLSHNDVKTFSFNFEVQPDQAAEFLGGSEALDNYLEGMLARHIEATDLDQYVLASAVFTIDEQGKVTDTELFNSSREEDIDAILMDAIHSMPAWTPARYADGTVVAQTIAVSIGDPESCSANLLRMR